MSLQEQTAGQVVNEPTQAVTYQVIPANPIQPIRTGEGSISDEPGELERVANQHLGGGRAQRIEVLDGGDFKEMYVDDIIHLKDLPRNERATALYRADYLADNPLVDPESLPYIAGTAVLFD